MAAIATGAGIRINVLSPRFRVADLEQVLAEDGPTGVFGEP